MWDSSGHFSPECFSNLTEVNIGSNKVLMLKSNAVPNVAVPMHFNEKLAAMQ